MSKTRKVEARVLPARLERYRQAQAVLRLDETSDFVRRACDELADRALDNVGAVVTVPLAGGDLRKVKPDPRKR